MASEYLQYARLPLGGIPLKASSYMRKVIHYSIAGLALLGATIAFFAVYFGSIAPTLTVGSVVQGNEYVATSTAANSVYGASVTASKLLKTGQGSLGSVVVTGANTGIVNFYNATTTDVTQRITATSTILIASIPASLAAGTYVFDATFTDGLYIDLVGGNMPTTTVTYR